MCAEELTRREFGQRGTRLLAASVAAVSIPSIVSPASAFAGSTHLGRAGSAFRFLNGMMDKYQLAFDVYTDVGAAGNHFLARGKMPNEAASVLMDEGWATMPYAGASCIRCDFTADAENWGGFYFMNGLLGPDDREPVPNWADTPNAGLDLRGASQVTFYARGELGGERVEFFVGGVGWGTDDKGNSTAPNKPYPDSFPKMSTGYRKLSKRWTRYTISLRKADLSSYVLGGFGWVTNAVQNHGRSITFYLDNIRWNKTRLNDPRFLASYETIPSQDPFDYVMRNVAFSYDNALALLAFLAGGTRDDTRRARLLADAFVYAFEHDRFYEGDDRRLRNGYSGGDLILFPGWTPNGRVGTVRMPGFAAPGTGKWLEDEFQVSTDTGNVAWPMIALLSAYQKLGDPRYLDTAKQLGAWVVNMCADYERGAGGFTGGYRGWEKPVDPRRLMYKSTEHNMDLYVAFKRLHDATGEPGWLEPTEQARQLVEAMWDPSEGKFWTGTLDDGVTINKSDKSDESVIPLDVQAWAVLAFPDVIEYRRGLQYVEQHHALPGGFDYNTDLDGIWLEGTAHMSCAYRVVGQAQKADVARKHVEAAQYKNGAIPAASKDGLTTGFDWLYYHRAHVGATAWYLLAAMKVNPYWL